LAGRGHPTGQRHATGRGLSDADRKYLLGSEPHLVPEGKTDNATRFVPMSERMKIMLRDWCGSRREGWSFRLLVRSPVISQRSPRAFRLPEGGGLDKKVPYSARPTYIMEKSGNAFAVRKSMGHADLKSMEPYQHHELEPLRIAINQRNQRKKFGRVLENAS
jgi:integrase